MWDFSKVFIVRASLSCSRCSWCVLLDQFSGSYLQMFRKVSCSISNFSVPITLFKSLINMHSGLSCIFRVTIWALIYINPSLLYYMCSPTRYTTFVMVSIFIHNMFDSATGFGPTGPSSGASINCVLLVWYVKIVGYLTTTTIRFTIR